MLSLVGSQSTPDTGQARFAKRQRMYLRLGHTAVDISRQKQRDRRAVKRAGIWRSGKRAPSESMKLLKQGWARARKAVQSQEAHGRQRGQQRYTGSRRSVWLE